MTPTKTCPGCERTLPVDAEHFHFYRRSPDGFRPRCRECHNAAESKRRRRARRLGPLPPHRPSAADAERAAERVKLAAGEAVLRFEAFPMAVCPGCGSTLPVDHFPKHGDYCRPCAAAVARETARLAAVEREKAERRAALPSPSSPPPDIFLSERLFDPHEVFLAMADNAEDLTALGNGFRLAGIVPVEAAP